jgi:hypothetical protein
MVGALDEMEAQRARAQTTTGDYKRPRSLQKARGPKPRNRVRYRQRRTPEDPARHRKSHRRVAQMHDPHTHPQIQSAGSAREEHLLSIGTIATLRQTNKAHPCHRNSTEVIGVTGSLRRKRRAGSRWLRGGRASQVEEKLTTMQTVEERRFQRRVAPQKISAGFSPCVCILFPGEFDALQCASVPPASVARPAGGTTTVDKLPSEVSF